ncbi:odorant receptor 10-like [Prorops nasuta]|uniref:odorant receptor 10-like n=1 Tax=Prorops nasuta TaxID=863751 RepID=UPI0034CF3F52
MLNETYARSFFLCMQRHRMALEFSFRMQQLYNPAFALALLVLGVLICSSVYIATNPEITDYTSIVASFLALGTSLLNSMIGQKLIDLSHDVANRAYFGPWIYVSPSIQKLLIIVMRKCDKPCSLNTYNLYTLSIDCFRMVNFKINYTCVK